MAKQQYVNASQGHLSRSPNITVTLDHGVHSLNLPLAIDRHDIVVVYRCSLASRSKPQLQHDQIAIDPDISKWSKSLFRITVKEL